MTQVERLVEVEGQTTGTMIGMETDAGATNALVASTQPASNGQAASDVNKGQPVKTPRADGITLLAIYNFILGGLFLLGMFGVSLPAVITALVGIFEDPGAFIATFILGIIAMVLMVFVVFFLAIGYGLWHCKQWARIASMVVAVLSLFGFPIGTFIGGFTIWYLIQPEVVAQFEG